MRRPLLATLQQFFGMPSVKRFRHAEENGGGGGGGGGRQAGSIVMFVAAYHYFKIFCSWVVPLTGVPFLILAMWIVF